MSYRTSADLVVREHASIRAALGWALPAFGLGILGMAVAFLGHGLASRALQLVGFAIGAAGVLAGLVTVGRAAAVLLRGVLRRE
jgi:tellurite resistance protein TehA-like permease